MRILLAPDKFRDTFTAAEVCEHLTAGLRRTLPTAEIVSHPLADGGEGTLDVLLRAMGGVRQPCRATGPMGEPITAFFGVTTNGTAILESADFCGISLVPADRRDPFRATSRGLGEAIAQVLGAGHRDILIGLGGTASLDGGAGMAEALGYRITRGETITIAPGPEQKVLMSCRFRVLCDVGHPLLGPGGAVRVFGPQKGARPADLPGLESRLELLCGAVDRWRPELKGVAVSKRAGAAGGLGWGAAVFLGAERLPGAEWIMGHTGFDQLLSRADLVVTGEGSYDEQSHTGKVTGAVTEKAMAAGVPVIVAAGRWDGSRPQPGPALFEVMVEGVDLESLGARIGGWAVNKSR